MFQPERAPVRPRVLCPQSGEALPPEDEARALHEAGACGLVQIVGPPGSGKTTALRHVAAVLPRGYAGFIDDDLSTLVRAPENGLTFYATQWPRPQPYLALYHLAPWGEDEWIEYLLAVHRERCGSVVKRLRAAADRDLLPPLPGLWRAVLDELAADETVVSVRQALQRFLARELTDPTLQRAVRVGCLKLFLPSPSHSGQELGHFHYPPAVRRFLRHEGVQILLAAEQVVGDLRSRAECSYLWPSLPRALVREIATRVVAVPEALEHLRELVTGRQVGLQFMAASILHATETGWVPDSEPPPSLFKAYLAGAAWPYVRLSGANLRHADLSAAYLHEAVLERADAYGARLSRAVLQGAALGGFIATEADLTGADLSRAKAEKAVFDRAALERANLDNALLRGASFRGANLTGASFVEADLSGASLDGADITDADFTGANFESADLWKLCLRKAAFAGARFPKAVLVECDLEYVQLPAADFGGARLDGAYLTGSWMPEANFENARLRRAGLADVNWAGACLRGADLRGASFHAGSSRSGLVGSPLACEGSRTGFYTDDSEEQYFKAPEEVRKANLCGADLRGALVENVDFYLVDLRGALFDPEQEEHFRRCRAILEARV